MSKTVAYLFVATLQHLLRAALSVGVAYSTTCLCAWLGIIDAQTGRVEVLTLYWTSLAVAFLVLSWKSLRTAFRMRS